MPLFFHSTVAFGDQTGWGQWLQEHQYEHSQFIKIGQTSTPLILWPDYDLASWQNTVRFSRFWLNSHQDIHNQLRNHFGITGINFADVDLNKAEEFDLWIGTHAQEHATLRQAFGITS